MKRPSREELCQEILRIGGSKSVLRITPALHMILGGLGIMGSRREGLTTYGKQIYFKLLRGENCPEVR
jgi:hypothetical protein